MLIPDTTQTIVAPSSAPGSGAIAAIRLSGPLAFSIAAKFLTPDDAFKKPKDRFAYMLKVRENGKVLDQTVTILYSSPKSYTGENMVEIFCHGSPYIVSGIVNLAIRNGAKEAQPGEFTLRAFVNGKLDLAQAEAVNDLILSESAAAHQAAIAQIEGGVSKHIRGFKSGIVELLSELEVRLDDSYEELPGLDAASFRKKTRVLAKEIKTLAESFEKGRFLKHGIRVAITGAPNSGKSSLLNSLLGYDRAIVAPSAGTTRDTLEEKLSISGFSVLFTDTAGIRAGAMDPVEKEGIKRTIRALKTADLILWVQDVAKKADAADRRVEKAITENARPGAGVTKIFNKSDLTPRRDRRETAGGIALSSKTGKGIGTLKKMLTRNAGALMPAEASAVITSARHFQALTDAGAALDGLIALTEEKNFPLELAAEHLKRALDGLAVILGETTSDEILADVFGRFCVGK